MKKYSLPLPLSPLARMTAYLLVFTLEVVTLDLMRQFLQPLHWDAFFVLTLTSIIAFPVAGTALLSRRTLLSHTTSGATLLLLSAAALSFSSFPAYLLPFALGISYCGSRPFFHQIFHGRSRSLVYSAYAAIIGVIGSMGLAFGMQVLERALLYSHLYS